MRFGSPRGEWKDCGLSACRHGHPTTKRRYAVTTKAKDEPTQAQEEPASGAQSQKVTRAQEIYDKVNELVEAGVEKAEAFKQLSQTLGRPYDSVGGSYYSHKTKIEGGDSRPSRTRRRETTPDDALADARAALERAVASIDREVEAAEVRATEAGAEAKALAASAADRKKAITERLEALK
jgi:hypothetical protein